MNFSNSNLSFPKLKAIPAYGDGMRYHAEIFDSSLGINCYGDEFEAYLATGEIKAVVDWGPSQSELYKMILRSCRAAENTTHPCKMVQILRVHITVNGIGRRPAMALLASKESEICITNDTDGYIFPHVEISWRHSLKDRDIYPEYLVTLKIFHGSDDIIQRHLHALPPPVGPLPFRLQDVIWAPGLFNRDEEYSNKVLDSVFAGASSEDSIQKRRRGFGLELETVQLPPDFEEGCFTHQQQFTKAVETAREWHLSKLKVTGNQSIKEANKMWDHFLSWSVSHDLYVENAAPPTRLDLYQQIDKHLRDPNMCANLEDSTRNALDGLILGGRVEIPKEILSSLSCAEVPISLASPEYKSPPPPNELYHSFPPPLDGVDAASDSIRLFIDGILKNPVVSSRPVAVPTVSDIGQSASSIHVHVNINNKHAWPRERTEPHDDIEATQSLLCVVFGWICFDRVIQSYFNMPNVWRDRSFAPMFATGPEFEWRTNCWEHGSSVLCHDQMRDVELYNIHEWFRHVHTCFKSCQEEKRDDASLFEAVFDHKVLSSTLSRWNSLNLLSLKSYGTIEFRRQSATLNADFISAWTWFCVGFVEGFSASSMFQRYLHSFLETSSWEEGLECLANAQHHATIEDLFELMCDETNPMMPRKAFDFLMKNSIQNRSRS